MFTTIGNSLTAINWSSLSYELYPLFAAVLSMGASQSIKLSLRLFQYRTLNIKSLLSSGGMPSSHSALVSGLSTAIGLKEGFNSSLFCVAIVLSAIILYDASGVRLAVDKQAKLIAGLREKIEKKAEENIEESTDENNRTPVTLIGHTPIEVYVGVVIGIVIAGIMFYY